MVAAEKELAYPQNRFATGKTACQRGMSMSGQIIRRASCEKCTICTVHSRAICHAASRDDLTELGTHSFQKSYRRNETIIAQGEYGRFVGNVVSGVLRLVKAMPDGRSQVVGLLYPGDFFGRVYGLHHGFAIEAASDASLCCIDRVRFEIILERSPDLERALLVSALHDLTATRETLAVLGCRDTMGRLAAFLLRTLRRVQGGAGEPGDGSAPVVTIPISRRDLADYLGTTIETISRHLQALSRDGVVRIVNPRRFVILDMEWLMELAGETDETAARRSILRKPVQPAAWQIEAKI